MNFWTLKVLPGSFCFHLAETGFLLPSAFSWTKSGMNQQERKLAHLSKNVLEFILQSKIPPKIIFAADQKFLLYIKHKTSD